MATMREVAEKASVSITTVSHVLNGTRFVSDELAKRVRQAVVELDYQPDQRARGLRKGLSETIAVVVSDIGNPFFPGVVRGAEDCARERNYSLILCNTDEDPEREDVSVSLMLERRVDGFLIAPSSAAAATLRRLDGCGTPFVVIDRPFEDFEIDQVYSNNKEGARQAISFLINQGHKRIGIIVEMESIATFRDRVQGWREAHEAAGLPCDENLIWEAGLKSEGSQEATRHLMEQMSPATAVFATNNLMVLGVLKYLRETGRTCPEDLSVLGFDDPGWARSWNPALTVVAQDQYRMGYTAMSLLLKRIVTGNSRHERVVLPCELMIRESCCPPSKTKLENMKVQSPFHR